MTIWPHEDNAALNAFYGVNWGPRGPGSAKWESENLVNWVPPYPMFYDGKQLDHLHVHRKCLATFEAAFIDVLNQLGLDYIKAKHLDRTGGIYAPRLQRGGSRLSVHTWACAIDMDPARNPYPAHWTPGKGMIDEKFVKILQRFGFTWRGRDGDNDPMHFQLATR